MVVKTKTFEQYLYNYRMKEVITKIKVPEGEFQVSALKFDLEDKSYFAEFYSNWRKLCDESKKIGGTRQINTPEAMSEGIFCMMTGSIKILDKKPKLPPGVVSSFDCYNQLNKSRIQVKASANLKSPSSYGPRTEWDEIYFMDFVVDGGFKGDYRIYQIDSNAIDSVIVNKKKNLTFKEMQKSGLRPRFSIYKQIIEPLNIEPIYEDNLFS